LFFFLSLDASVEDKSLGRLVNDDNKKPNCKMKTVDIGGMPHLCLFAIKEVTPGEERKTGLGARRYTSISWISECGPI